LETICTEKVGAAVEAVLARMEPREERSAETAAGMGRFVVRTV
jgi:hypothetical protein